MKQAFAKLGIVAGTLGLATSTAWPQIVPYGSWSLALSPQGQPHVSYVVGHLWLASRSSEDAWQQETVPVNAHAWAGTSLAIDAAGDPLVACIDCSQVGLCLARRIEGVWSVELVDAGVPARFPSLVLDGLGHPRVAYVDESSGSLKFCAWDGTSWAIETVAAMSSPGAPVPHGCSLALESDDHPSISFFDYLDSQLKLASRHSGTWSVEVVQGPIGATWSSLALEADDDPWIGFCDAAGNLALASRHQGSWEVEAVDAVGGAEGGGSIALDSSGRPCASYGATTDWTLRFAAKPGSAWDIDTVDTGSWRNGTGATLALDAQDVPHVAYNVSRDVHGLEYATRLGTTWQTELVVPWPASVGGPPVRPPRLAAWPNPIRAGALHVWLSAPNGADGLVDFSILDMTGRRLATVYRGPVSDGGRLVTWDQRDERGRAVPSGVYLLSARSSHGGASPLRIVILR